MKLGISLDAYLKTTSLPEAVTRAASIGFDAIDLNLVSFCQPDSPLARDDWRDWIGRVGEAASTGNIWISQVHAPICPWLDKTEKDHFLDEMTVRTMEAARVLDIPWTVFHARTPEEGFSTRNAKGTISANAAGLRKWADIASGCGTSIAVENTFFSKNGTLPMFCTTPEENIELIDAIDRQNVAACLDTGHAFVAGYEPAEFAKALGDRLKVLHVHDNLGIEDQHVAPFAGAIDWGAFMASLRSIGFDGVFSFEVHRQVQNMPEPLIDTAIGLVHDIGRHLTRSL